jgi:hypothetical protein
MSKSVELVQCGSCFQFVPPDADGMPDQNHICYKADPAMQAVRLSEYVAQQDAETAARLAAETIVAQQAEIRRLERRLAQAKLALNKIADNCIDWTGTHLETFAEGALKGLED